MLFKTEFIHFFQVLFISIHYLNILDKSEVSDDKSITKSRLPLASPSLSSVNSPASEASYAIPLIPRYWLDQMV